MPVSPILGRLVSAIAGRALARSFGGVAAGPAGAAIGLALPMVARRLGPMGMVGMAAGAWAINHFASKTPAQPAPLADRAPLVTPPPIPMVVADHW